MAKRTLAARTSSLEDAVAEEVETVRIFGGLHSLLGSNALTSSRGALSPEDGSVCVEEGTGWSGCLTTADAEFDEWHRENHLFFSRVRAC